MQNPKIQHFFDEHTNTFSYVISDVISNRCAIIDSVLNYDAPSATSSTIQADLIIQYIHENSLSVEWILETHVHADHLTASQYLKKELGGKIAMSQKIAIVQETFNTIYNMNIHSTADNQIFDYLFEDYEQFHIGQLNAYNIPTPGHTPACISYVIENCVFVGDTLFMPDYGTARCDFPKGSASELYDSIKRLYELDENMRVLLCHDYLPENRDEYCCESSIYEQKNKNIHLNRSTTKTEFIEMRNRRDATLSMPKLILPAIQINMNAGKFPTLESNGIRYLKLPFNYFRPM